MSQLRDLISSVNTLREKHGISLDDATEHLDSLLSALEWDISDREPERWLYDKEPDEWWKQKEIIAKQEARKLLERGS